MESGHGIEKTFKFVGMDIQSEKLHLIRWLTQLTDEGVIAKIKALRNEKTDNSIESKSESAFDAAYATAEKDKAEGRVKAHTEVRKKYEKWL